MVDTQSATAEIRRGKKRRRKKPHGENIMSASAMQGGHKKEDRRNHSCKIVASPQVDTRRMFSIFLTMVFVMLS